MRSARRARRSARARDRATPRGYARAAGAHSCRPRRRGGRGRELPRSDRARADAGPAHARRHAHRRGGGSPKRSSAAKRSPSSATTMSTARRPRRCWGDTCAIAACTPLIHIPDRLFEGYGPNAEAVRALAARGATLLVAVDCGTTSHEPLLEARKLGLDVIVIDHHQADERLPRGAGGGQSQPARRSLEARPSRRRRPRVHDRGRGQPRTARARVLDAGARRSRTSLASSIWSRSARSPTWCRSRASTAPSSPRACSRCAGATIPG